MSNNKKAVAEVLIRQVLGESETFERVCAQRGVSVLEALTQAVKAWMGPNLRVVKEQSDSSLELLLPIPSECPPGQEEEWMAVCEHDLSILRDEQRRCRSMDDVAGYNRVNQSIETYIQAMAELRARVA